MTRSITSIANRAIDLFGGLAITSLNDNTKAARALNRAYTPILEDLLSKHNWSFCKKRIELAVSTDDPLYEYTTAFDKPEDFLRILEVYPKYIKYQVEGQLILADAQELKCKYIALITDPTLFTSEFAELFSKKLAAEVCFKVTQNRSLADDLKKEFEKYYRWAASNDSKGSGTSQPEADDIWMVHRGYGSDQSNNATLVDGFDYGTVS